MPVRPPRQLRHGLPRLGAVAFLTAISGSAPAHAATLAAVSPEPGQASVFARDAATGRLIEARWSSTRATWIGWRELGGAPTAAGTDLAAVAQGKTIYLFTISTRGQLQVRSGTDGRWGRDHALAPFRADGGPAAVRTGAAINTLVRRSDGRVVLVTWQLPSGKVRSTITNVRVAPGTGPGVASVDGRTLRAAVLLPGSPARRRVGIFGLDPTRRVATIKSKVSLLPGTAAGSPSVTQGAAAGATSITVRSVSGAVQQQDQQVRGARAKVGAWSLLGAAPLGAAAGDGPATLAFEPAAGSARSRATLLPTADGRALLQHTSAGGWTRFPLSPPGTESALVAPSTLSQPAAAPASLSTPVPTPSPAPTPTPTPPPQPSLDGPEAKPAGTIRYFGRTSDQNGWDAWFQPGNTPAAARAHILRNVWRMELFANSNPMNNGALATNWFPGGMVYRQLYTIDPVTAAAHPSWVMRTASGEPLYADDGANPRTLLAGNIFNPAFRAWMISHPAGGPDQGGLLQTLGMGAFAGLWLDNVNPELLGSGLVRVDGGEVGTYRSTAVFAPRNSAGAAAAGEGQSSSTCVDQAPPAAEGLPITDACWAQGVTSMLAELRAKMPARAELLVNVPWYRTQRDPSNQYDFITTPTPAFQITPTPPKPGPLAGGLWTSHGKAITDIATYVNIEGAFWANASTGSGDGYGAAVGAGRSTRGYSLDMLFRYIDALHRRGKGFVADNWMDRSRLDIGPQPAGSTDDPLLRVQEFNLAGYAMVTDGRDGIGDFNPRSDGGWPAISGSGGGTLYGMDLGTATTRPSGTLDPQTNADDPGPGINGRGVAAFGASPTNAADGLGPLDGNRLWARAFLRKDGKRVFVLLAEPAPRPTMPNRPYDRTAGAVLNYTLPAGTTGCTNMTRAADASYARWDAAAGTARLGPSSALFLLCDAPGA